MRFMLSLVINLDRSPNRLAAMTAQAERHSLPFQRIRAIDGLALPDDMRAEFLDERGGIASKMIVGEVGCYASHMRAWQRVVADRLPHAMVLEDDVILGLDVVAIADAAVRSCPAGWDLIHLNGRTKKSVVRVAQLDTNHRLIRYTLPPLNSCAYIISQAGARKMLRPAPRMRPSNMSRCVTATCALWTFTAYRPRSSTPAPSTTLCQSSALQRNASGGTPGTGALAR